MKIVSGTVPGGFPDNLPQYFTLGILQYVNNMAVLGEGDTCCLLLQHHGVNILLDCSAAPQLELTGTGPTELQPAGHTLQQQPDVLATDSYTIHLRVPDIARCVRTQDLHAVLVTSPYALLGLPHLQKQLQQQGKQLPLHVYCTEPVYHTFQHVATELLCTQQLLQQVSVQSQQQELALQQVLPSQLELLQQQMQQHVYQLQQQVGTPPPAAPWPGQQQQQQVAGPSNFCAPGPIRPPMPPPMPPPALPATATAQRTIPGPRPPPIPPVQGLMAVQQGLAAMQAASGAIPRHVPPPVPPPQPPPAAAAAAAAALGYTSAMPGPVPPDYLVMPAAAAAAAAAGAQAVPLSAHMPPPAEVPCNAAVAVSAGIPPPRPPPTPPCAPPVAAAAAAAPRQPHPVPTALPPPAPPSGSTALPPLLTAVGPLTAAGALLPPMLQHPYGHPTAVPPSVPAGTAAASSSIPPPAPPVAPRESSAATVPRAAAAAAAAGAAAQAKPQIPPPAPPLEPPPPAAAAAGGRPLDQAAVADQHPLTDNTAAAAATGVLVPLFTLDQLQSVLDRLQIVRFGERVVLPGCWGMTAEARPSGSSAIGTAMWVITAGSQRLLVPDGGSWTIPGSSGIGTALWVITAGLQRIAYLSPASLYPNHSAPLHKPSLQNLDARIIGPGSLCPDLPSLPLGPLPQGGRQELAFNAAESMLRMAAAAAATAVRAGGRVLVPVLPAGGLLQLLEHIPAALEQLVPNSARIPLLYLSPVAADALALANSCCEYLETKRRDLVLSAGQPPFEFEKLVTSGRLKIVMGNPGVDVGGAVNPSAAAAAAAAAAGDRRQQQQQWVAAVDEVVAAGPCVVFVSLWSMAAGPGSMLADLWSSNPSNLLLLTEQGPLSADWIQGCKQIWQQQQQRWQILYCPIDSLAGCPDPKVAAAASASATFGGKADPANRSAAPLAGNSEDAGACRTAVEGCLTAGQLARLLGLQETAASSGSGGSSVESLLLGAGDWELLEQALGSSRSQLDGCRITTLLSNTTIPAAGPACSSSSSGSGDSPGSSSSNSRLSFQLVDLPDAFLQVSLGKDLAKSLLLIPAPTAAAAAAAAAALPSHEGDSLSDLNIPQVSLARVRGLLCHKSGVWLLEPLPGGTKPGAVAAAVDQQQQQGEMLIWGSVDVTTLLGDLQAAGFENMYISTESMTLDNGSTVSATVIKLPDVDAEIRLSAHESEVICDAWHVRKQLTDALMKQLRVL